MGVAQGEGRRYANLISAGRLVRVDSILEDCVNRGDAVQTPD